MRKCEGVMQKLCCVTGVWVRLFLLLGLAPAIATQSIETALAQHATAGGRMTIDDKTFAQVPLNTRERTACSPQNPGPEWRGILIQAPAHAAHPASPGAGKAPKGVPVCGLYTLDVSAVAASGPMMLVALDRQRGEIFKGAVVDDDPSPEIPPPNRAPFDPARYAGVATGSYFNPDLAKYVKLPVRPAIYEVFVEYGGAVSNRVTIELTAP
jgi:hypothetical protein